MLEFHPLGFQKYKFKFSIILTLTSSFANVINLMKSSQPDDMPVIGWSQFFIVSTAICRFRSSSLTVVTGNINIKRNLYN